MVLLLDGRPVLAIVVEVQLSRDEGKRRSWPVYLTSLQSRVDCPTVLLVVAPEEAVARWCAQPIRLGHPGFVLQPLVAGPRAIPVIRDEQAAREDLELAVLSAMAHGRDEQAGPEIVQAVMGAVRDLEDERSSFYFDLVLSSLGEAARRTLEALMKSGNYEYQTEFVRKWVEEGLQKGRQEGRLEGRQEGRQEGEAIALLEVLDARGIEVGPEARQKIQSCTDAAQLKAWLRLAVKVDSVRQLFEEAPAPQSC